MSTHLTDQVLIGKICNRKMTKNEVRHFILPDVLVQQMQCALRSTRRRELFALILIGNGRGQGHNRDIGFHGFTNNPRRLGSAHKRHIHIQKTNIVRVLLHSFYSFDTVF